VTNHVEARLVDLTKGEVYIVDNTQKVHVLTSDGLFSPSGTRFNVSNTPSATTVVVEEGIVRAAVRKNLMRTKPKKEDNRDPELGGSKKSQHFPRDARVNLSRLALAKQTVVISAGYETRVRRGAVSSPPQKVNVEKSVAWAKRLQRREPNLLVDPGFEQGGRAGWRLYRDRGGNSIVTEPVHSGRRALQIDVSRDGLRKANQHVRLLAITDGTIYVAEGWVKITGANVTAMLKVMWLDSAGKWIRDNQIGTIIGTRDWTRVSTEMVAPTAARFVLFAVFTKRSPANSATVWFDDLYLGAKQN